MPRYIPQTSNGSKSYATEANAVKAAEKLDRPGQTYIIMVADNGRFVPVFIGERAIQAGIHFSFHILG